MNDTFPRAIAFVLSHEGGYVNRASDPGGETNFGISKRSFPNLDIKNLTREQACAIFKEKYWDKCGCDSLPFPLDLICLDTAVNMGVGTAKAILGRTQDPTEYLFRRIERYVGLNKPEYLAGWINRVCDLYRASKEV